MFDRFLAGAAPEASTSSHRPGYTTMQTTEIEGFEREGTAEVGNDPRFYEKTIVDKRLAAFHALAIITAIIAAVTVKQCFEMPADFTIVGPFIHVAIFQVIGYTILVGVLYITMVTTAVLSLQLFFAIRLMTAGPTGYDKSASFYTDKRMWHYRERAVFGMKWGIVGFFTASGFMLYVKLYTDGARKGTVHHDEEMGRSGHKIFSAVTLTFVLALSITLTMMVRTHQRVFNECYTSIDACHPGELNRHLNTRG